LHKKLGLQLQTRQGFLELEEIHLFGRESEVVKQIGEKEGEKLRAKKTAISYNVVWILDEKMCVIMAPSVLQNEKFVQLVSC
jgi:hypothetical protein